MTDKIVKNDRKSVLVLIEAWEYNSTYLKYIGRTADIGLFAEAFTYYDRAYVNLLSPQTSLLFTAWKVIVYYSIDPLKNISLLNQLVTKKTLRLLCEFLSHIQCACGSPSKSCKIDAGSSCSMQNQLFERVQYACIDCAARKTRFNEARRAF